MTGIIGRKDGSIPFHSSADMKRFRELTKGAALIVGRKTFDGLPRLLGRVMYVLSRSGMPPSRVLPHIGGWDSDPDNLLKMAVDSGRNVFIIGGAEVYHFYSGVVTKVYETIFETSVDECDGDVKYNFDASNLTFVATVSRGDESTIFRDYTISR